MANIKDLAPYFGAIGQALIDLDADKAGADDFAGGLLVYVADVIQSVSEGADLPPLPDVLQKGTADKINGPFKAVLIVANSVLTIARFQVRGKAATALRYVVDAISKLISGQVVPPAPKALL